MSVLPQNKRKVIYNLVLDEENHKKLIDDYMNREDIYQLPFEEMKIKKIERKDIEKFIEYEKIE